MKLFPPKRFTLVLFSLIGRSCTVWLCVFYHYYYDYFGHTHPELVGSLTILDYFHSEQLASKFISGLPNFRIKTEGSS